MKLFLIAIPFFLLALLLFFGSSRNPAFFVPPDNEVVQGYSIPKKCEGWTASDQQWLPADRMYEKINGHASLYIQFGVEGLIAASWTRGDSVWDMSLFVMSNAHSSAAVYTHERPQSAQNVECAEEAYTAPGTIFARDALYYVKFMALAPDAQPQEVIPLVNSLLTHLSGEDDSTAAEDSLSLPEKNQLPKSKNVSIRDAFGFTSLKEVTHAKYAVGGTTATWYFTHIEETAFHNYTNELHEYGAENFFSIDSAHGAVMFGDWEILEHTGTGIQGVRDAPTRAALEFHWKEYIQKYE